MYGFSNQPARTRFTPRIAVKLACRVVQLPDAISDHRVLQATYVTEQRAVESCERLNLGDLISAPELQLRLLYES